MMNQIILGTAEFNPLGYAGKACPETKEIIRILNTAWEARITLLDCSSSYGCDDMLNKYASEFGRSNKSRDPRHYSDFYHYDFIENNTYPCSTRASVYTVAQLAALNTAIVPFNINNTEFIEHRNKMKGTRPHFIFRSVFDRGRLLEQGYSVRDCLSFVKRHYNEGIIIGVSKLAELEEILKAC